MGVFSFIDTWSVSFQLDKIFLENLADMPNYTPERFKDIKVNRS
jgi:hypothetical protein